LRSNEDSLVEKERLKLEEQIKKVLNVAGISLSALNFDLKQKTVEDKNSTIIVKHAINPFRYIWSYKGELDT
jgi:hypothetical protein